MKALLLPGVLLLCTCQKYVFEERPDRVVEAARQEITIDVPSESDILFVLDNSGSMAEEIARVRTNIISFVQKLSETDNKFRIAFTTTDNRDGSTCDDKTGLAAGVDPIHDGRCGRFLAPKGKPAWLDKASFATPQAMANEIATYLDPSTAATDGSAVEQPIKSAINALNPDLRRPGGPNEGFFRDASLLVVAFVTDESDCSFGTDQGAAYKTDPANQPAGFNCYAQSAGLKPTKDWAAEIVTLKGRRSDVRVGLISASATVNGKLTPASCRIENNAATDECACFFSNATTPSGGYCQFTKLKTPTVTPPGGMQCGIPISAQFPMGQEGNCCIALANERMFAFADEFQNLKDTICQPDFSSSLLKLADLADRQCFDFEKRPLNDDPANVQLRIRRDLGDDPAQNAMEKFEDVPLTDAAAPTDGWYYESDAGSARACLSGTFKRKQKDTISLFVVSSDVQESTETAAE